ncbi:DUF1236 domain-containing protein [Flaviflagellibacter deserti]|uniref:DUF1236 domain-containing protein n=1 Tax=Flaviflagellibacter deserti TaxID=2267266 RepID=A0ABV9Z0Z3_9HYPH
MSVVEFSVLHEGRLVMQKIILMSIALIAANPAFAEGTGAGAASGAAAGAVVGGPVGAVVGGVAGAAIGTAIDPPPAEVRTVVMEAPPPRSVVIEQEVQVGQPLPETVVLQPVPRYEKYTYAVVNEKRVIVEPSSRKVLQVIN